MAKVRIKNRKTGVVSEMTYDQWEKTKKNPLFDGVFFIVENIETPPEVNELKEKQAEKHSEKTKKQTEK